MYSMVTKEEFAKTTMFYYNRRNFLGTWEVIGYKYHGTTVDAGLEGVQFKLDEDGDVMWTVSDELKSVLLFSCETYEIYQSNLGIVMRFGAGCAGHVIEFRCEESDPGDSLILNCEGWCVLYCKKVKDEPLEQDFSIPFSLLPALEDGYFYDIKIKASNNKEFKVHSYIVQLLGSDIQWQSQPPPFENLPEDVIGIILHYLYSECLTDSLDEPTAREVINFASKYNSLEKLISMCQVYLKNLELKQQTISLVNDMHNCINQAIDYFNPSNNSSLTDSLISNPAKLCIVVKQSIRETAVASAKLLLLCDLFTKRKNELTREERHEIILYVKSRMPVFMEQIARFLHALKSTFSSMTSSQRQEVATYLVPEIEVILDTLSMLTVEIEKALQQIIQTLSSHDNSKSKSGVGDMFGKSLRNVLHIRELTKIKYFHEHITCSLRLLLRRKENFNKMSPAQKISCVTTDVEKLIEELPMFLMRLEDVTDVFDDSINWREFKFCFKVGTSKLSGILQKLVAHRDTLQTVMIQLCNLVQRNAFTQSLQMLGLLDTKHNLTHTDDCQKFNKNSSYSMSFKQHQAGYKLNLVESLCTSPTPATSKLSKNSFQLLKNGLGTDMEFEVVVSNSSSDQTVREHSENSDNVIEEERCIIRAHRAIVASRCDWFRRALLSGMREAIDRKIVIHDTNPFLFRVFLEYLYSGRLRRNSLTTEHLAELFLLSDRYEVDLLKQACESTLASSIDKENVLYFLSMADQFNARHLRNMCLNYIRQHQELTESDLFEELPISLQSEIFDCIWFKDLPRKSSSTEYLVPNGPESSIKDIQRRINCLHLSSQAAGSLEDIPSCRDNTRLEPCLLQLRDIVGEAPSREKLTEIILAADYDLCRAINYFYTENNQEE